MPPSTHSQRCDDAMGTLADAAGGIDQLLERYALVVMSDHGQTHVTRSRRSRRPMPGSRGRSSAHRTALRTSTALAAARSTAARLPRGSTPRYAVEVTLFREGDEAVARRQGEELAFAPDPGGGSRSPAMRRSSTTPTGSLGPGRRSANPNAGELLVSAAEGYEFADLGGGRPRRRRLARLARHRRLRGAAAHPSASTGMPRSIVDVAPLVLATSVSQPPRTRSAAPPEVATLAAT